MESNFEKVFGRSGIYSNNNVITFWLSTNEDEWVLRGAANILGDKPFVGECVYSIKENKITANSMSFIYDLDKDCIVINGEAVAEFSVFVLRNRSPYAWDALISSGVMKLSVTKEEPFGMIPSVRCIFRLMVDMPDEFERTIKTSPMAVKNKWLSDKVGVVEGKKLPVAVNTWAIKQKNAKSLVELLQFVCEHEDGNNTVILMNYFKACLRISKAAKIDYRIIAQSEKFYDNILGILSKNHGYTSKKLIEYLIRQSFYYGDFRNQFEEAELLRDYIELADAVGMVFDKYPSNIRVAHNVMVKNTKAPKLSEEELIDFCNACKAAQKYEVSFKDYCIVIPTTPEDLLNEGVSLNHCVAGYAARIARKETIIGFLRTKENPSTPLYTIEIKNNSIVQAKGQFNSDLPKEMDEIINGLERKF